MVKLLPQLSLPKNTNTNGNVISLQVPDQRVSRRVPPEDRAGAEEARGERVRVRRRERRRRRRHLDGQARSLRR